jgi:hypothetical protein
MKDHPMHAIIMEMLKDNPNERISSADVVSRLNNLTELHQLRIGLFFNHIIYYSYHIQVNEKFVKMSICRN